MPPPDAASTPSRRTTRNPCACAPIIPDAVAAKASGSRVVARACPPARATVRAETTVPATPTPKTPTQSAASSNNTSPDGARASRPEPRRCSSPWVRTRLVARPSSQPSEHTREPPRRSQRSSRPRTAAPDRPRPPSCAPTPNQAKRTQEPYPRARAHGETGPPVSLDLGQEGLEPISEYIVIVAGDHVACRLHVDGLGVRDELEHVG
jgi:hypothetical protein